MDYNKKNGQLDNLKIYESLYRNSKFQYEIRKKNKINNV